MTSYPKTVFLATEQDDLPDLNLTFLEAFKALELEENMPRSIIAVPEESII